MQNLKESWQKVPEKTRKIILGIVAGTAVIALIAILALTFGRKTDYSVLFSGLSQEEAQQIGALLQDQEIDYKYNASDGTIRVPEPVVEWIAARRPRRAVFRDAGFAGCAAKLNVLELFKRYMPESANDISKRVKVI